MKTRLMVGVIALLVATLAWASINLNSSRSNVFRMHYPPDLVTQDQAHRMLADLDKMGTADEAKLKQWLPANFKRYGIDGARVKKLIIMPRGGDLKETAIILLTNPADEKEARATAVKKSQTNASD